MLGLGVAEHVRLWSLFARRVSAYQKVLTVAELLCLSRLSIQRLSAYEVLTVGAVEPIMQRPVEMKTATG